MKKDSAKEPPKEEEKAGPYINLWQAPAQLVSDESGAPDAATSLVVRPISAVAGSDWAKPLGAGILSLVVFGLVFAMYRVPEKS